MRIKHVELISLNGFNKLFSRNHSLLVHQIVSIDLPDLKLHFAVICDQMLSNVFFVCFVATSNGTDAISKELALKITF